mgnify:CR=1 FL=1
MALTRLPGLIDVHVHLRDPGATQKEDFRTGSRAGVKGGFTFLIDMPNNPLPTITPERLAEKIALAGQKALLDVGFHYGTNGYNLDTFSRIWSNPKVFGLKVYCSHTTGDLFIESKKLLEDIWKAWESPKPIVVHAEGEQLALALDLTKKYKRRIHECHISLVKELELVRQAKKEGVQISAGVCPHHLFLTEEDEKRLGVKGIMRPPLATQADQMALWDGIQNGTIDLVETDHAPHLLAEKEEGTARFGVPGLETSLGLLAKGVRDQKITEQDITRLLYSNPQRIFNIPVQEDTFIEVDFDKTYTVGNNGYETKCAWSPFEGWELPGLLHRVVLRKETLYPFHE